jgi:hypothetical protein
MRIWSVHPKYLDSRGLVALWREALLAKHVLEGKTKAYKNHPQLERFKYASKPLEYINHYLSNVLEEAEIRGYAFDKRKIDYNFSSEKLKVTTGQLKYETSHLLNKLKIRDKTRYHRLLSEDNLFPHPMFIPVEGDVESWEVIKS